MRLIPPAVSTMGRSVALGMLLSTTVTGCSLDKFFNVAPPLGRQTQTDLQNSSGAEGVLNSAKNDLFNGLVTGQANSVFSLTAELTDEMQENSLISGSANTKYADARRTAREGRSPCHGARGR